MGKFCSKCGSEIPEGSTECSKCAKTAPVKETADPAQTTTGTTNTAGIIALCCGIGSIVLSWYWITAVIGIVAGIFAIIYANKSKKIAKNGMATGGLVCGIIGLVFCLIWGSCSACVSCASCAVKKAGNDIINTLDEYDWSNWDY